MKKSNKTSALLRLSAIALCASTLVSCSGKAQTTDVSDTSAVTGADTEKTETTPPPEFPEYDFSTLELSKYVTLPAGYAQKDYKEGLTLLGDVKDEEVDAEIRSSYLLSLAKYPEESAGADAVLQDLDRVIMDYTGKLDGVAFGGGTAVDSEHDISILHSTFIDGFDREMLGMKEGETRDLNLKFPEKYQNAELAGKSVVFTVTVDKIIRPEIPELTDALVAENPKVFGEEAKTAEEFRASVKKSMSDKNRAEDNGKITDAAWKYIAENAVFPAMPEEIQKGYEKFYNEYYLSMAESYGKTLEELVMENGYLSLDAFKKEAVIEASAKIVREKLIIHSAAKDLGVTVTDEEAKAKANEEFKEYIEPNIAYYTMYLGIKDLESFINYMGGLYVYKENLLYNTVLEKICGITAE